MTNDRPPTPTAPSAFATFRSLLDQRERRRISNWHVAVLLGIAPGRVGRFTQGKATPRPALLLALAYAARVGYEAADDAAGVDDPTPRRIAALAERLPFAQQQTARLLGLSRSAWLSMRRPGRRMAIGRAYVLALLELEARYGAGSQFAADVAAAEAWEKRGASTGRG